MTDVHDRGANALLDDYAAIARRRGHVVLEQTGLRLRSTALREIAAHLASDGRLSAAEIANAPHEVLAGLSARWVCALGRMTGLQNILPEDHANASRLLGSAVDRIPARSRHPYSKLLVELLHVQGDHAGAKARLHADDELRAFDHEYLLIDLLNPYVGGPFADAEAWWPGFTRRFREAGLVSPTLLDGPGTAFDMVHAESTRFVDGPLVSVVMTTFYPDARALVTSVRSILQQSWGNFELLIMDDASPPEFDGVLQTVAAMDDRIKVTRLPQNRGTYVARNDGLALANGEYVTGQDDDDWSHPERLERQIRPLLDGAPACATRSRSLTVRDDLIVQRPGYPATRPNASSLMFPRALALELGGFLPVRRAADSELHHRLEAATGLPVLNLQEPLALVRIEADSLSRSDFRAGYHHPARRAFRGAFERWHTVASRENLRVGQELPIPVPAHFASLTREPESVDVVLAGDWRQYGGPQKSMLEEAAALRSAGYTVGILHIEAARFMSRREENLCDPVQDLINAGEATRIINDQQHVSRLTVLRYPPILQFPPDEPLAVHTGRLLILANQAPSERDGSDIRYDVRQCSDNAERLFGVRGTWVPQGPTVRSTIAEAVHGGELAPYDIPGILDLAAWQTERSSFRSDRPIIGRHSRDNAMKWPESPAELLAAYPVDGSAEVRVMGGAQAALEVLGRSATPQDWVVFGVDELEVRTFLNSIDFFVYFQHSQAYDAFGRAVLEALAAGCVAVLPHRFEETFGDAAVYCHPHEVPALIEKYWERPDLYRRQSERAVRRVAERFSHGRYAELIHSLLEVEA